MKTFLGKQKAIDIHLSLLSFPWSQRQEKGIHEGNAKVTHSSNPVPRPPTWKLPQLFPVQHFITVTSCPLLSLLSFPSFYKCCVFVFVLCFVVVVFVFSLLYSQNECNNLSRKPTRTLQLGSLVGSSFCSLCLLKLQQSNWHPIFSFCLFCLRRIFLITVSLCLRNLSRIASSHSTQGCSEEVSGK